MKILKAILFLFFIAVLIILWRGLFVSKSHEIPSALIGEDLPSFRLNDLTDPKKIFTEDDLKGHVSLLNVWATWCYACSVEYPFLMRLQKESHIPIYGIDYKDDSEVAKKWLKKMGNPFVLNGQDTNGDVAIDLGIYGTPETFVINPQGKIIYRHLGVLDENVWQEKIYPLIKQYEKN